ncbi:MAG TPA: squalene/phytoene synthase family protein [Glaciibacter sp.]|nr:squalene/phytoene synthase family protein [Glaciibacter sp.]
MTDILHYNAAARASSATVIDQYSTSFGLAARLLSPGVREAVRSIYALVRISDEIVDGAAAGAGVTVATQRELLDELEQETMLAIARGFSTNLVVHAFANTARQTGINERLIAPFFASMRRDLSAEPFTASGVDEYIYGSAEVVGLMCLRCFLLEAPRSVSETVDLEFGARRLGAAFQKVNFLRDLAADSEALGRNYFPGIDPLGITESEKTRILDDIDADLAAAARVLPLLPRGSRAAVTAAHNLFARLSRKLRATPAEQLLKARVRVPNPEKLAILAGATFGPGAWKR